MAGLIPIAELEAAGDITTASLVRSSSQTRAAMTELLDDTVTEVVTDVVSGAPAVVNAAAAAVGTALASANIPTGYPQTPVTYSSLAGFPLQWTYMQMNDTYADVYSDTYTATWVNGGARRGDVAILDPRGKLLASTIPASFATVTQVDEKVAAAISDMASGGITIVSGTPDRPTSWWGRLLKQRRLSQPSAIVFVGSSTSAIAPGFIGPLVARLQTSEYPGGAASAVQWSTTATFTPAATTGLHGYSAAVGGTTSSNYLDTAEMDKIAALSPACIVHMVGANDYTQQVNPVTYETNMRAKLAYFDSVLTAPCLHVLIHSYAHRTFVPSTHPASRYRDVLASVAASRTRTAFVDLSPAYIDLGVPGSDPLALIGSDDTHQTVDGYALMTDLLYKFFTR